MPSAKFVVFSNAAAGRDDEFNRWYDNTHLREVCDVPGVLGATRYRVKSLGDAAPRHRYLAIYELDPADPEAALGRILGRAGSGGFEMSDTLDPAVETLLVEELARSPAR